ncbi:hypothetical protein EON82_00675 [bacterium]|nr:MAG: hypothetical protein EON82_00675 [bacterium]
MARKVTSLLGIDLEDYEVRVVEIRYRLGKPSIAQIARAPIPPGAVSRGIVVEPGLVAVALRRLLDSMNFEKAEAVFGVADSQTLFRAFTVPFCSEEELPTIVEGEIEHHNLVHSDEGLHDFFRLHSPAPVEGEPISLTVVAANESATNGLREVAERAGVTIAAIEPSSLAMLRSAALSIPASQVTFVMLVGTTATDTAFFIGGRLTAFRRIEVGSNSLVQNMAPALGLEQSPTAVEWGEESYTAGRGDGSNLQISDNSVDRLANETRHTLEYLRRRYPDFAVFDRIHLVVNQSWFDALPQMLEGRLGSDVELVRLPAGDYDAPDAILNLAGPEALRFMTAYGLAAYEAVPTGIRLPEVDLFSKQRKVARRAGSKRNFLGSILVSAVAIVLGVTGLVLFNRQISRVDAETKLLTHQTEEVRGKIDLVVAARLKKAAQYKALRKEGIPLGVVMDYVVGSIRPGVGLKSVAVGDDLGVKITGDALTESDLIETTRNLQNSPVLSGITVNQFSRPAKMAGTPVAFELSAKTVTAARLKFSPRKAGG